MAKKVLLLSGALKLSGSSTWILNLHKGFVANGDDVIHIVTGRPTDFLLPHNLRFFYTGACNKQIVVRLMRLIRAHRWVPNFYQRCEAHYYNRAIKNILDSLGWASVDIVVKDFTAYLPSWLAQFYVVSTIHQQLSVNWPHSKKLRQCAQQRHSKVVAVSCAAKQDALALGINVEDVIFNPIDAERITELAEQYPIDCAKDYLVFVGSVNYGKGVVALMEAFYQLNRADIKLCYIGHGDAVKELKQKAQQYGIADRVIFTGFLSNPYPWIKHAKLLVLPSETEVMGYCAIEAVILGTPILVNDFDGAHEFYRDECLVRRFPKENYVQRLAERISTMLVLPEQTALHDGVFEAMQPIHAARCFIEQLP